MKLKNDSELSVKYCTTICPYLALGYVKNCTECNVTNKNEICYTKMKDYGFRKEANKLKKALENTNIIYSKYYK